MERGGKKRKMGFPFFFFFFFFSANTLIYRGGVI
jgi:hypothetical protein